MKLEQVLPSLLLILDKNIWQEAVNDVNLVVMKILSTRLTSLTASCHMFLSRIRRSDGSISSIFIFAS